jgi:amino-acid N-acetyltransferase
MKRQGGVMLRPARDSDARSLYRLISANRAEGHLLPRTLDELTVHATRFVVAMRGRRLVGCAELASLSPTVAEIRSLAVDRRERGEGIGTMIVDQLRRRARHEGFERLCAFTHAPAYFIHMGFSIVPHTWLLEKLATDCVNCPLFRTCGQYAVVVQFDDVQDRPLEPVHEVRAAAAPQAAPMVRYA